MAYEYDYTVPEIAKRFGVCNQTVVNWIKKDILHGDVFYRRRPKYRVLESEVLRFEKEVLNNASERNKARTTVEPDLKPTAEEQKLIDFTKFIQGMMECAKFFASHPELAEVIVDYARKES